MGTSRGTRVPASRVYYHARCGGRTAVSGLDFTRLANPFSLVQETFCCGCGGFVKLRDVCWADTDESIADYRARLRREAPLGLKLMRWLIAPGVMGGLFMLLLIPAATAPETKAPALVFGLGAFFGALVGFFLGGLVGRLIWRTDYRAER
jgi:hypothetical protein